MCGRYAMALPPSLVRRLLEEGNMPSQDAPEDDETRQTHNFAPGYFGLVYRADVPDYGAGGRRPGGSQEAGEDADSKDETNVAAEPETVETEPKYKLQAMKWGLVPFWTKRNPDYGTLMRTINCRDDSLATKGGMWQTMKQRKRCIVVAQGFFEWLKKNNGKDRIPHFVKRKDGQLMCFAGLWDCVKYEDAEDKTYTYSIITTDPCKQISWLHDRMPVILNNGSPEMFTWLDSSKTEWSKELQSVLKPFDGELECYQVNKDVGKVGNDSPSFIIPLDSKENKQNIANFFGNQKKKATDDQELSEKVTAKQDEPRETANIYETTENNAPKPIPAAAGMKHKVDDADDISKSPNKSQKIESKLSPNKSPIKSPPQSAKKTRSATSNNSVAKSPTKAGDGSKKITSFFTK